MATIDKKIQCPEPDKRNRFEVDLTDRLIRYTSKVGDILNKGIRATDNWDAYIVTVTLVAADVEQAVAHTLKRVPTGFMVLSTDKAAQIYNGGTAWTATNIYIRSNVANTTAKVVLI